METYTFQDLVDAERWVDRELGRGKVVLVELDDPRDTVYWEWGGVGFKSSNTGLSELSGYRSGDWVGEFEGGGDVGRAEFTVMDKDEAVDVLEADFFSDLDRSDELRDMVYEDLKGWSKVFLDEEGDEFEWLDGRGEVVSSSGAGVSVAGISREVGRIEGSLNGVYRAFRSGRRWDVGFLRRVAYCLRRYGGWLEGARAALRGSVSGGVRGGRSVRGSVSCLEDVSLLLSKVDALGAVVEASGGGVVDIDANGVVVGSRVLGGLKEDLLGGKVGAEVRVDMDGDNVGDLLDVLRGEGFDDVVVMDREHRGKSKYDWLDESDVVEVDAKRWYVMEVSSVGVVLERG